MNPDQEYGTATTYTVEAAPFVTTETSSTIRVSGTPSGIFDYTGWAELSSTEDERVQTLENRMNCAEADLAMLMDALTKVCGILAEMVGVEPPECEMSAVMQFIESIPVKERG